MPIEVLYLQAKGATGLLGLTGMLTGPQDVLVDSINGPAQVVGVDFRVTGASSTWVLDIGVSGSSFYSAFNQPGVTGVTVRIGYNRVS